MHTHILYSNPLFCLNSFSFFFFSMFIWVCSSFVRTHSLNSFIRTSTLLTFHFLFIFQFIWLLLIVFVAIDACLRRIFKAIHRNEEKRRNALLIWIIPFSLWKCFGISWPYGRQNQILCYLFPLYVIVRMQPWNTWYKTFAIFACPKVICAQIFAQGHCKCKKIDVLCIRIDVVSFVSIVGHNWRMLNSTRIIIELSVYLIAGFGSIQSDYIWRITWVIKCCRLTITP